jgi:disulfide bond formation protein DsbB
VTRNSLVFIAAAGSAALLAGAFVFQALGYLPCAMCLWQRWPHLAAVLIGAVALAVPGRLLPWLGALAALTTGLLGVFHSGVEQHWWQGPTSCTGSGGGLGSLAGGDLLATTGPRLIMCDQISWQFLYLSMPTWNAVFSLALVVVWIMAARRA